MHFARFLGGSLLALAGLLASPASAADISAEIGLVSDYRYRGLSLSDGQPVVQASLTLEHDNGLYGELWSSTLGGSDPDVELDLTAGYTLDVADCFTIDFSGTYYLYPGDPDSNYGEATLFAELSHGPTTAHLGISFTPAQRGTRDEEGRAHANSYLFAGLSYDLTELPMTVSAEIGHERGAFDEAQHGGKWDWQFAAEVKVDPCRVNLAYFGSDADDHAFVASILFDF